MSQGNTFTLFWQDLAVSGNPGCTPCTAAASLAAGEIRQIPAPKSDYAEKEAVSAEEELAPGDKRTITGRGNECPLAGN